MTDPGQSAHDVTATDKADLFVVAADRAADYIRNERFGRVFPTVEAVDEVERLLRSWTLDAPLPAAEVIEALARLGDSTAVRSTGGRYFGFVTGGTEPAALAASVLAAAWDQNLALPAMSPLATAIDRMAARWVVDLLGLPPGAVAAFCGGASVANLIAVTSARDALLARRGWSVAESGLRGAPRVSVIASTEAHVSVVKALRIAGWGTAEVVSVPTDELGRMQVGAVAAVEPPVLVVAQMGNVNTGHSDPVDALAALLSSRYAPGEYWIHVDGAFGLWAAASKQNRAQAAGVELAHSWATDAHKWLNTPYDCGIVAVADGHDLRRAMSADAAYLPGSVVGAAIDDEDTAPWSDDLRQPMHLGVQMSQAARAVPVLAVLATLGAEGVAELIDRSCRLANRLAQRLSGAGARILAPPGLNQVLVHFGSDTTTDRVVELVQDSGTCWAGATTWQGRRAMRISVCDSATTIDDVDAAAEAIIAAWRPLR